MKTVCTTVAASLIATFASAASLAPTNSTVTATGPITFSGTSCSSGSMTIRINGKGVGSIVAVTDCPSIMFSGLPWPVKARTYVKAKVYGIAGKAGADVCPPRTYTATVSPGYFTIIGRGPCNIYAQMVPTPPMSIVP